MRSTNFFVVLICYFIFPEISVENIKASMPPLTQRSPKMYASVNVIWDDGLLATYKIKKLQELRSQAIGFRFNHFVDPHQILSPHGKKIIHQISSFMSPEDTVGLYIKPTTTLLSQLKTQKRLTSGLWRIHSDPETSSETILASFDERELRQMVQGGKGILEQAFRSPVTMAMSSDWSFSPKLSRALESADIYYNFSPISPRLLAHRLSWYPIFQAIQKSWPNLSAVSGPFRVRGLNSSLFIPQTAGSPDYLTSAQLQSVFLTIANKLERERSWHGYFIVSLYFSTLGQTVEKLITAMEGIQREVESRNIDIQPLPKSVAKTSSMGNSWNGAF